METFAKVNWFSVVFLDEKKEFIVLDYPFNSLWIVLESCTSLISQ